MSVVVNPPIHSNTSLRGSDNMTYNKKSFNPVLVKNTFLPSQIIVFSQNDDWGSVFSL